MFVLLELGPQSCQFMPLLRTLLPWGLHHRHAVRVPVQVRGLGTRQETDHSQKLSGPWLGGPSDTVHCCGDSYHHRCGMWCNREAWVAHDGAPLPVELGPLDPFPKGAFCGGPEGPRRNMTLHDSKCTRYVTRSAQQLWRKACISGCAGCVAPGPLGTPRTLTYVSRVKYHRGSVRVAERVVSEWKRECARGGDSVNKVACSAQSFAAWVL